VTRDLPDVLYPRYRLRRARRASPEGLDFRVLTDIQDEMDHQDGQVLKAFLAFQVTVAYLVYLDRKVIQDFRGRKDSLDLTALKAGKATPV